jgi:hypothetical protein
MDVSALADLLRNGGWATQSTGATRACREGGSRHHGGADAAARGAPLLDWAPYVGQARCLIGTGGHEAGVRGKIA